jgi:hypothetical protein
MGIRDPPGVTCPSPERQQFPYEPTIGEPAIGARYSPGWTEASSASEYICSICSE